MTKHDFFQNITASHATLIKLYMSELSVLEPNLTESVTSMMGNDMLCYSQDGEFKYGFMDYEKHISFHNMVMYCYPDVRESIVPHFKKSQLKKSCINFNNEAQFPIDIFKALIETSRSKVFPKP